MPNIGNTPVYPPERWQALGLLLRKRRIKLMDGVDNQAAFCRLPGGLRQRFVNSLEKGRVDSPPTGETIRRIELAWHLREGAVGEFLSNPKAVTIAALDPAESAEAAMWRQRALNAETKLTATERELARLRRGAEKLAAG